MSKARNNLNQQASEEGKNLEKIIAIRMFTSILSNDGFFSITDGINLIDSKLKLDRFLIDTGQVSDVFSWSVSSSSALLIESKKWKDNPFVESRKGDYETQVNKGVDFLKKADFKNIEFLLIWIRDGKKVSKTSEPKLKKGTFLSEVLENNNYIRIPNNLIYEVEAKTLIEEDFDDLVAYENVIPLNNALITKLKKLKENRDFKSRLEKNYNKSDLLGIVKLYEEYNLYIDPKLFQKAITLPQVKEMKSLSDRIISNLDKSFSENSIIKKIGDKSDNDMSTKIFRKSFTSMKASYLEVVSYGDEVSKSNIFEKFKEIFGDSISKEYYQISEEEFDSLCNEIFKVLWGEIENENK